MGGIDQLAQAVESGDASALDVAADRLLATSDPDLIAEGAELLQQHRLFVPLLRLADAAVRSPHGAGSWTLRRKVVRALIELGAAGAAEGILHDLLRQDPPRPDRGKLLATLGRIAKDRFVDSGEPEALRASTEAYALAHETGVDPLWTGVNLVALRALADRRGIDLADAPTGPTPEEMLAIAATAPVPRPAWAITTELEMRLARGELDALPPLVGALERAPDATGFVFASLARQLIEIWELDPADPVVAALADRTLARGEGEVLLPGDPGGFEKLFGSELPVPIDTYLQGADRARSVGMLLVDGGVPAGTVFVMRGDDLHEHLAGRTVLVTNEHVVPSPDRGQGPRAEELEARFQAEPGDDGRPLTFAGLRSVWHAPSAGGGLDITLLVTTSPAAERLPPLHPADTLPPVRDGSYVYVVGHPGGGQLALSIRGNELLDHDGVRLHYRAPTTRGSSGSPVFDQAWRLIGVHHYSSSHLARLNGATGSYGANQGSAIEAVRNELRARPPTM